MIISPSRIGPTLRNLPRPEEKTRIVPGVLIVEFKDEMSARQLDTFNRKNHLSVADVVRLPLRTVYVLQMERKNGNRTTDEDTLAMIESCKSDECVKSAGPNCYSGREDAD